MGTELNKVYALVLVQAFALFALHCGTSHAQSLSEYLTASTKELTRWGPHFRSMLQATGSNEAKRADAEATFAIKHSPVPYAALSSRQSNKVVEFSNAKHMLLVFLADVDLMTGRNPQYAACQQAYWAHIYKTLSTSSTRMTKGESPLAPKAPEEYLGSLSGPCRNFASRFPIDISLRKARDDSAFHVFMFIYLHELGHQALRHKPVDYSVIDSASTQAGKEAAFLRATQRSRMLESMADVWAVEEAVTMRMTPGFFINTNLLSYFLAHSGMDCFPQSIETHPNGFQRYAAIVETYERVYRQRTGQALPGQWQGLAADIKALAAKARKQLECSSN